MPAVFKFDFSHPLFRAEPHLNNRPREPAVFLEMWVLPVDNLNAWQCRHDRYR
jgi:hypothetical protein